jgi:flagellum-specific ATP synthase
VLNSISRVAVDVVDEAQMEAAVLVRRVLAVWEDIEDLVSIGAYTPGTNPDYDVAVQTRAAVNRYLQQDRNTGCTFAETTAGLKALGELIEQTRDACQEQTSAGRQAGIQGSRG